MLPLISYFAPVTSLGRSKDEAALFSTLQRAQHINIAASFDRNVGLMGICKEDFI